MYHDDVYNISYNDGPGVKFSSQKSRYVWDAHVGEYISNFIYIHILYISQ